jgi:hypothetical protein
MFTKQKLQQSPKRLDQVFTRLKRVILHHVGQCRSISHHPKSSLYHRWSILHGSWCRMAWRITPASWMGCSVTTQKDPGLLASLRDLQPWRSGPPKQNVRSTAYGSIIVHEPYLRSRKWETVTAVARARSHLQTTVLDQVRTCMYIVTWQPLPTSMNLQGYM